MKKKRDMWKWKDMAQEKKKKTSCFSVIARILTVATKPSLKNHLVEKCGLGFNQYRYIEEVLEAGLLDAYPIVDFKGVSGPKDIHRMVYSTSKKGKDFLKRYNELMTLMQKPHLKVAGIEMTSTPSFPCSTMPSLSEGRAISRNDSGKH